MTERSINPAQTTGERRTLARGLLLVSGGLLWLVIFLGVPCALLVLLAFASRGTYGQIELVPTLGNFARLLGFGTFGWSADYLWICARTVWLAAITTLACIALAYPMAFFVAARAPGWRSFWLVVLMIPFCTNLVIRTYGWELIFSQEWPLAKAALAIGLLGEGESLCPGSFAVFVGMVSSNLSFAVLPLYTSVERLDWSLVDAAQDLYASRWNVFRHGILPQTRPGLVVATIITFIPCLGMFVVSDLLGGGKTMLIGNLIQQQFGPSRDFPFGAALSFTLIIATLVALWIYRSKGEEAGVV